MSTQSKMYWTIRCDVCENLHSSEGQWEYTVYDEEADALDAASDSDWRIFPDMHVCCWCIDKGVVPDGAHADDPDDVGICRWCGDEWPHE